MLRIFSTLALAFFVVTATAQERKTLISDQKRFSVSQEEAATLLAKLKKQGDINPMKKRPALNTIANFNGGTAKEEETPDLQARPCWADESQFKDIQQGLIYPVMRAWVDKDVAAFNKHLAKNSKIEKLAVNFKSAPVKLGNIDYFENWNSAEKGELGAYLQQFKKIEDFDLVTMKYTSRANYREKNLDMIKADLHVQFDLRGITTKGERRNDRGPLFITVVKVDGVWKIEEIKNWGIETLVSTKPSFSDYTKASGVEAIPEYQRLEAIRRGGYAMALGDVNNDGFADMYVGAYGPGKLLFGGVGGVFKPATDSGVEDETLVKSAAFADFNNDGNKDLLLTRFVPTSKAFPESHSNDILIYKNLGNGKFKKMSSLIADRSPSDQAMPAAVGDFNGDGLLDFYVGFPGAKDFTVFGKLPEREEIRAQGVYMNLGDFRFSENNVGDYNKKKFDTVTEHHRIYPHSAVAFDFDQDGNTDIVVIDDRGNVSPAYRGNGKGGFTQAEQYIGVKTTGFGMGMAAADIDNNGILDLVFTNVNFAGKYRMESSCKSNWDHHVLDERDHGLKFYYGIKKGQYADATMKNGLFFAGEGLAAPEFIDYNNDGFQDLYVANGLWSGTNKEQDLSHVYIRSNYADDERVMMEAKYESQSETMRILAGFVGDIFGTEKKFLPRMLDRLTGKNKLDTANSRPHLAGFQRNRLFRNKGDGTFLEVGYLENIDSIADGYIMAKSDIDNDGKMDIVLRNGDPGTSAVNFPAVQVFKNESSEGNSSIRLKLLADISDSDAVGATVTVTAGNMTQYQQLIANNGAAQSEEILQFGIGNNKVASKVVITWPVSKKVTTLYNVKPGLHIIKEKKGLSNTVISAR